MQQDGLVLVVLVWEEVLWVEIGRRIEDRPRQEQRGRPQHRLRILPLPWLFNGREPESSPLQESWVSFLPTSLIPKVLLFLVSVRPVF